MNLQQKKIQLTTEQQSIVYIYVILGHLLSSTENFVG